jgi:hypothetical protein
MHTLNTLHMLSNYPRFLQSTLNCDRVPRVRSVSCPHEHLCPVYIQQAAWSNVASQTLTFRDSLLLMHGYHHYSMQQPLLV